MENEIEKLVKNTFRDYISREVSRPQIQEDKKKLLQSFYQPQPFFEIGWMIPAGALAAVFVLFLNLNLQKSLVAHSPKTFSNVTAAFGEPELAPENPRQTYKKPRVIVKRVASQIGPTLIYQRSFRNIPVTVIWVFPGGGPS